MQTIAAIAVALLGLLHAYILILEMFFWTQPAGLKAFGLKPEFAQATKVLAANQGLYNGFLAAGLFWGLVQGAAGRPVTPPRPPGPEGIARGVAADGALRVEGADGAIAPVASGEVSVRPVSR